MPACPKCGEENPERARFCWACGTAIDESPRSGAEERKIVSVIFVDLVGFTAASEQADPEDVRARLRPYHARVKQEIERFGGTVEKFVGDAVMAVFGAPVSREDDAERAVNAALRILDALVELNDEYPGLELSVRGAVNTGEAMVTLGARPAEGESFVAGDVVNTAARLQQSAPVGGIVVGETTYRATKDLFEYEPLDAVAVKGKAQSLPLWQAIAPRRRFGVDVEPIVRTPLIGRDDDLALLQSTYTRTLRDASVQLVTVTGEPGVGKTRLLAEFRKWVDDRPELVFWRQGRSLSYGEGITYWALGEMVKAQAGILESDTPEEAVAKLAVAVQEAAEDPSERDWLNASLAPLAGAGAALASEQEDRPPHGVVSSRGSRAHGHSSWSSRISTGPTMHWSLSSSTSSTGRVASRCSCSAAPGPSCTSGTRVGAAASGTPTRSRFPRWGPTRPRASSPRFCRRRSSPQRRSELSSSEPEETPSTPRSLSGC